MSAYLEIMSTVPTVKPMEHFSREEWRDLTAWNAWMGPLLVLHCWALVIAAGALFVLWPNPVTYLIAVMIIGARQLGLAILMHEAAHGLLSKNRAFNDFLGSVMTGAVVGADLRAYRNYHLKHHKFAQQAEDPDLVLSEKFPVTRASLRRKIIRDLTGQTFFKQRIAPLLNRAKGAAFSGVDRHFLIANATLLLIATLAGYWWAYFALWVVPLATWNPLVTRLRNIAEHACVGNDDDPWRVARTTHANFLERLLIAPYWVHYHSEHHLFMYVPCYRLKGVHDALADRGLTARMHVERGYPAVLGQAASA
ncbi:MAG: fatty acid desaturase family protein [Pseudomonadota bacterium]